MSKKIGFTWSLEPGEDWHDYETDDNSQDVIPLHIDQPGVEDLEYWQEEE